VTPPPKVNAPAVATTAGPHVKRSAAAVRQQTNEERRRAQRVLVRISVLVHLPGKPNPLQGFTHTVSANGAMIILPQGLPTGSKFTIENPKTQQKVEVHVVRPPQMNAEGSLVPVEFTTAAPLFWNIFFPPNPQ
jgi:hypothetical protein